MVTKQGKSLKCDLLPVSIQIKDQQEEQGKLDSELDTYSDANLVAKEDEAYDNLFYNLQALKEAQANSKKRGKLNAKKKTLEFVLGGGGACAVTIAHPGGTTYTGEWRNRKMHGRKANMRADLREIRERIREAEAARHRETSLRREYNRKLQVHRTLQGDTKSGTQT